MTRLRIGFGLPTMFTAGPVDAAAVRAMAAIAEAGGLSTIAVGDHLNWYSGTLESTALLGFLAAESPLELAANVVVLPLRNPYLLAKQAATIAYLSRGGLWLGVGVGGEHSTEFAAIGIDVAERRGRMEEALAILADLLAGRSVEARGRFYRSTAAPLDPPVRVPVLIGGRGPAALRRAATIGDGWSAAWVRPEQFEWRAAEVRSRLTALGRPLEGFRFVVHVRVAFAGDAESAWRDASGYLARHYGTTDTEPFRRQTICGPPGAVVDALQAYAAAGAGEAIVTFASDDHARDLRRFCDEVMTRLP